MSGLILLNESDATLQIRAARVGLRGGALETDRGAVSTTLDAVTVKEVDQPTDAPVITLCGSTRFKDEFMAANQRLTLAGNVVISVGFFGHADFPECDWTTDAYDLRHTLDALHFQKIRMADEIYVVDPGGYVGDSTRREIAYAESLGKRVQYLSRERSSRDGGDLRS